LTPERWAQIEEVFHRAVECDASCRDLLLDQACSGDLQLRREVEALLSSDPSACDRVQAAVDFEVRDIAFSLVGEVVSHYRILAAVGGGGMGLVYRAEDIKLGRQVAVKFLPEDSATNPAALARFEREARAASALEHPNICPIYEFGEHQARPFLVMPLLQGQTLKELLETKKSELPGPVSHLASETDHPLQLNQLLDLGIQIANGLEAAHQKYIVHRDIKPANIFVTSQGQAKILDFGLAKLSHNVNDEVDETDSKSGNNSPVRVADEPAPPENPDRFLSRTGVALGTAGYMSPEQVRGEKLDTRTDLFSFGLVLYEMAVGQRAFKGENAAELHHAILQSTPTPPRSLNPEVSPGIQRIIAKALEKDRELRYQSAFEIRNDLQSEEEVLKGKGAHRFPVTDPIASRGISGAGRLGRNHWASLSLILVLIASAIAWRFMPRSATVLAGSDLVLVDDFVNATDDPIFDGTLKQAVNVKLAESPYFNIVPESKVAETMRLMEHSAEERVVPPLDREVCQRAGGKVAVSGAIAAIGTHYRVSLRAIDCLKGTEIAHEETEARDRDYVLSSLGRLIPPVRKHLGEVVSSIQKFNTPIEQATTKSLPALKAYTSGDQQRTRGLDEQSVPFYKMAVDLDPDFAMAYARLGAVYGNLANAAIADEYLAQAFERREHVSEREKFYIASHYYEDSTRENDKAIETLKLWTETYPHDWVPYNNLSAELVIVGQPDDAVKVAQEALHLNPANTFTYFSLARAYIAASRFIEARAICDRAIRDGHDSGDIHSILFGLASIEDDETAVQHEHDQINANGEPGPGFLDLEAEIAFSLGNARKGRDLFQHSRALSLRQANRTPVNSRDYAGYTAAEEAHLEAELGNSTEARDKARVAISLAPASVEAQSYSALVFANLGDDARAGQMMKALKARFPVSTLLTNVTLPAIQATIAIRKRNYQEAIDGLRRSVPYDLGSYEDFPEGITIYLRGTAYLGLGSPMEAAAEFKNLLNHRGVIALSPYWPLAHLGLARAYAMAGGTDRSLAEYREVLSFWKNADPDVPVLKDAEAEYEELRRKSVRTPRSSSQYRHESVPTPRTTAHLPMPR